MTEADLDQLFSRVFATPDGKRVLELIAETPEGRAVSVDVETRLQRARKRWATGADQS